MHKTYNIYSKEQSERKKYVRHTHTSQSYIFNLCIAYALFTTENYPHAFRCYLFYYTRFFSRHKHTNCSFSIILFCTLHRFECVCVFFFLSSFFPLNVCFYYFFFLALCPKYLFSPKKLNDIIKTVKNNNKKNTKKNPMFEKKNWMRWRSGTYFMLLSRILKVNMVCE